MRVAQVREKLDSGGPGKDNFADRCYTSDLHVLPQLESLEFNKSTEE